MVKLYLKENDNSLYFYNLGGKWQSWYVEYDRYDEWEKLDYKWTERQTSSS